MANNNSAEETQRSLENALAAERGRGVPPARGRTGLPKADRSRPGAFLPMNRSTDPAAFTHVQPPPGTTSLERHNAKIAAELAELDAIRASRKPKIMVDEPETEEEEEPQVEEEDEDDSGTYGKSTKNKAKAKGKAPSKKATAEDEEDEEAV